MKMAIFSINEVIEFAVSIERNGYAFYDEALKKKGLDSEAKDFLTFLRDQELNHEQTFLALRSDEDLLQLNESTDWEMVSQYLKSIVEGRIFDNPDSAIRKAAESKDILQIIDNAISFEKDTLLFFHGINDGVYNPEVKKILRRVIMEEVSHVLKLNDYKKKLLSR